jgi:hypothetical protein
MRSKNKDLTTVAIDIANPLKVEFGDVSKYVLVNIGDKIKKHDIIAKKTAMLGLGNTEIKSPIAGVVLQIDSKQGTIVLQCEEDSETKEQSSESDAEPEPDADLDLSAEEEPRSVPKKPSKKKSASNKHTFKLKSSFGEGEGRGVYISENLDGFEINFELAGNVLLISEFPSLLELYKASAVGVVAVLVREAEEDELESLKKELEGKVKLCFGVLPKGVDIAKLDRLDMVIKDNELEIL